MTDSSSPHPVSPISVLALAALVIALVAVGFMPDNASIDRGFAELAIIVALAITALLTMSGVRLTSAAARAWIFRLVLLSITLTITSVAAEFATRFLFRDVTTSSDNGGYFSRRWERTNPIHNNHAGFRGREFTDEKPAGIYRIAAVGDSFTFGNGVRQEDRYTEVLQAQLPPTDEVLNFGVPGDNTHQHAQMVDRLLPRIHPDFFLLQWYVNDVENDNYSGRPRFRPLLPFRSLNEWLGVNSALYGVMTVRWQEIQVSTGMTQSYVDYLNHRFTDPNSPDSQLDRSYLVHLVESSKNAGVPIGIVLFPDTSGAMDDRYPFAYLHERVRNVCELEHITCLDLRSDFAKVHDNRTLWASRLDHHPSARANAIAAQRILETFSHDWVK